MDLFDRPEAEHFCTLEATGIGTSQQSLNSFHADLPGAVVRLREGSTYFNIHRSNLLNAVERWLLYAVTNYRRAVEMLVPGSAPWAHVTLYYASFFAANAILGMFGGWISVTVRGSRVVDVESGDPGKQRLRVHRRLRSPNDARGSHRQFWDFFYDAVASLAAWTPRELSQALTPSTGDYAWQIVPRNAVNYDMFRAWQGSVELQDTFNRRDLGTLRGPLALQLEATEDLIRLAQYFAAELSVHSFGIVRPGDERTRLQVQRQLVSERPPNLIARSALAEMTRTR